MFLLVVKTSKPKPIKIESNVKPSEPGVGMIVTLNSCVRL